MANFFEKILQGLFKAICGGSSTQEQPPQSYPIQQQPQKPQQHQQHQQQQPNAWQQAPHKPPQQHQQQQQHAPSPPHHAPSPPRPHQPAYHGQQDANQVNQSNEHYKGLRAQANEEGDKMARCFEEGHQAYARGDGARAKELQPGETDLHGLYVKEAIARTDSAIQEARRRGTPSIRLIVGKGMHSQGGLAKIKPAIESLMQREQVLAEVDPENAGVLIVHLDRKDAHGPGMNSDDVARKLETQEGCVIM
ncbi:hypothetical protein PLICRDRAFT_50515 [Plicaturopsis crispa FD-325 SS-3]|nr:hypothetical protein PLICRDRAFT_50515 [Plicaturopsis crispa FD-325 SS-3]